MKFIKETELSDIQYRAKAEKAYNAIRTVMKDIKQKEVINPLKQQGHIIKFDTEFGVRDPINRKMVTIRVDHIVEEAFHSVMMRKGLFETISIVGEGGKSEPAFILFLEKIIPEDPFYKDIVVSFSRAQKPEFEGEAVVAGVASKTKFPFKLEQEYYIVEMKMLLSSYGENAIPLFIAFNVFFSAYEGTFIHEFTHVMDLKRRKSNQMKGSGLDLANQKNLKIDFTTYVTDPLEFNAFYQERAYLLDKYFEKNTEARSQYLTNFNTFYDFIVSDKSDMFIQHMNEKYKQKLIKRLLDFFHTLQEKYLES